MTWEEARAAFPVFERYAYLNAGTNGPLTRTTAEAMAEQERLDVELGRGGGPYFERALELRDEVRAKLAAAVGVPPEQLSLATSTTNGCNIVLAGLDLAAEDEVITSDGEHFGLLGALAVSQAQVRVAPIRELAPEESLEVLLGLVTRHTRLFALSHVCWMSGNRFPVEKLKDATGVPVLVDGAQSAGALELDATAFEFFAFSCQKWLCGPDARYDANWTPVPSLAGLSAARDLAPEGRFERALQMAERCRELVAERVVTAPAQGTLVAFRVEGDSSELVRELYERGVIVRDVPGQGWIRVSCGWWTSDEDLERLVGGLP